MLTEVTGCKDCPLRSISDNEYWCEHPKKDGGWIRSDGDYEPITPSDCPLFTEPLTISLKQD